MWGQAKAPLIFCPPYRAADGFVSYDKPIEVVKKSNASTTQRFIMALSRDEQAEDKKTESP